MRSRRASFEAERRWTLQGTIDIHPSITFIDYSRIFTDLRMLISCIKSLPQSLAPLSPSALVLMCFCGRV